MLSKLLLFVVLFSFEINSQFDFDFPDFDFPDFDFPDFDLPEFPDFGDFEPPCSCEKNHCECCIDISIIGQKGCIRVTIKNNRIRVSFVFNDDDLGGFSTNLDNLPTGITINLPCHPNVSLALMIRNSQRGTNGRRRFCLNALGRGPKRIVINRDFCFDVNGNRLTSIGRSRG